MTGRRKVWADIATLKHSHIRVVLQIKQEALLQGTHVGLSNLTLIPGFQARNIAGDRLSGNLEDIETRGS